MTTTTVIEDANVLIPNPEHQNFTATAEVIKKDTEITGEPKNIKGLRKGEPFTYKLFLTNDNKLIYLKKIKPMETQSGADSTIVNLKQTMLAKPAILGAVGGALAGFAWAKYKKHETKKIAIYALIGGVAGFVFGKVISHTATVKTV